MGGSPPRAWGQRPWKTTATVTTGFTPTCVGTASGQPGPGWPPGVHPHVRGDSDEFPAGQIAQPIIGVHPHVRGDSERTRAGDVAVRGSPPRAWGQLRPLFQRNASEGFTPTCVGTAQLVHNRGVGSPPRAWGQRGFLDRRSNVAGSPPRAWGQLALVPDVPATIGFTPTCVGTARCWTPRSTR